MDGISLAQLREGRSLREGRKDTSQNLARGSRQASESFRRWVGAGGIIGAKGNGRSGRDRTGDGAGEQGTERQRDRETAGRRAGALPFLIFWRRSFADWSDVSCCGESGLTASG